MYRLPSVSQNGSTRRRSVSSRRRMARDQRPTIHHVRYVDQNAQDKRENGDQHDREISQAEKEVRQASFFPVVLGERQKADNGRHGNTDKRQTERADQRYEHLQVGNGDGQNNCNTNTESEN